MITGPGQVAQRGAVQWDRVLLHHDPAGEVTLTKGGQDAVDVEVAGTQGAEHAPPPHLVHVRAVADRRVQHVQAGVFEVDMVDALGPCPPCGHRVASAEQQVPGVKAQPDVGGLQHAFDLLGRLHIRSGVLVKCRVEPAVPATVGCPLQVDREPVPTRII